MGRPQPRRRQAFQRRNERVGQFVDRAPLGRWATLPPRGGRRSAQPAAALTDHPRCRAYAKHPPKSSPTIPPTGRTTMKAETATAIRGQLEDRRRRLRASIERTDNASDLVELLQAVDAALDRLDSDHFERCDVCG